MTNEIKQRIRQIKNGDVPEGYSHNKIGIFPDDWSVVSFDDKFNRLERKNDEDNQNVLTISAQQGLINQQDYYNSSYASENKKGYSLLYRGDFSYNKSYSGDYLYGAIKRLDKYEKGIVSPLYICFEPKEGTNSEFYLQYFEAGLFNGEIYKIAQEGARNHGLLNVSVTDFFKTHLPDPLSKEQQKIAEILQYCDRIIELKQKLIDELNMLKKVYLSKMFPQKGSNVPEIRFAGFTDSWEQRKLEDVVQITMGQSPDGTTYSDEPSDYILIQGNADLQDGWVKPRVWTTQVTKKAEAGDLIMSVRAPAGAMGKTAYNAVIGRGVAAIKGNEFIFQTLVKMDSNGFWKKLSAGSTFESLNSDSIKNAEIQLPNEQEQEKIGEFFNNLDNLITLHQRELEEKQQLKKSLMQLLLMGIVRCEI